MWKIRRARFARNRQKSVRSLRESVRGPSESKRAFSLPETLCNKLRECWTGCCCSWMYEFTRQETRTCLSHTQYSITVKWYFCSNICLWSPFSLFLDSALRLIRQEQSAPILGNMLEKVLTGKACHTQHTQSFMAYLHNENRGFFHCWCSNNGSSNVPVYSECDSRVETFTKHSHSQRTAADERKTENEHFFDTSPNDMLCGFPWGICRLIPDSNLQPSVSSYPCLMFNISSETWIVEGLEGCGLQDLAHWMRSATSLK